MNNMLDRLNKVIAHSGLNRMEFARKCSINYYTISSVIAGSREINLDMVQKVLSAFPEIEEGWFVLGRGEMLSTKVQSVLRSNQ
jgi:predicted transcriptional regulator